MGLDVVISFPLSGLMSKTHFGLSLFLGRRTLPVQYSSPGIFNVH